MSTESLSIIIAAISMAVAVFSAIFGIRTSSRSHSLAREMAELSSEQEALRRQVRSEALYALIATYELIADLEVVVWMTANARRASRTQVATFLESRFAELSAIHARPTYYLLKKALGGLNRETPIDLGTLGTALDERVLQSAVAQKFVLHSHGLGPDIMALELNVWVSTADAITRLARRDLEADPDPDPGGRQEALERYGEDGAVLLSVLLQYFESVRLLVGLLNWAEPRLITHLRDSWRPDDAEQ